LYESPMRLMRAKGQMHHGTLIPLAEFAQRHAAAVSLRKIPV
jgi:hypothetical protein